MAAAVPPGTMTNTFETVPKDQLAPVIGGGIGAQIGGLFGAKGAQWGGIADTIFGMIKGGGGGSSGGGSSGGGGGGGFASFLGNIGKMFNGGGSSGSSGGSGSPGATRSQRQRRRRRQRRHVI